MSDWNSNQYMKFCSERTQPSVDLINRIPERSIKRALDIGCGPGNSTAAVAQRFPSAEVIGVDASDDMLQKARASHPGLRFEKCFVPEGLGALGSFDLIFSNACLHWIPDHPQLLKALFAHLNESGSLAVQMPLAYDAPFYRLLYAMIKEPKWSALGLERGSKFNILQPERYFDLLSGLSSSFQMWETYYYHTVDAPDGVLEWYKGSGLRPYLDLLDESGRSDFLAELLRRVEAEFPRREGGNVILKMPRLFFAAVK